MSFTACRGRPTALAAICLLFAAAGFFGGRWSAVPVSPPPRMNARLPVSGPTTAITAPSGRTNDISADAAPRGPAEARARAKKLEQLAHTEPARALALALQEPNRVIRGQLREAVLTGWATVDAKSAAAWAMQLRAEDHGVALAAVFRGAVEQPEAAMRLGEQLCGDAPREASTVGDLLIRALAERGAFAAAADFAAEGGEDEKPRWLNSAFAEWAAYDPESAARALRQFGAGPDWNAAFQGLANGWATANPPALAEYAAQLPAGGARESGLSQALTQWALVDPAGALAWINQQPPEIACDAGLTTVATQPDLVSRRPDIAIECAAAILQPDLRTSILRLLSAGWAERDRAAVVRFIALQPDLTVSDRAALTEGLDRP